MKSFLLRISGYQIDIGVWWLVLRNKCYNWCRCTDSREIVIWGYISPWLSYGDNFIKRLNRFMIVIMINVHYSWLGYCLCCFWWVVENIIKFLYIINYVTFWCDSLNFSLCVTFVFGAFRGSFPIGCTCSSCTYVSSRIGWCVTYSSYFLRLLVNTLNIF